MGTSIVDPKLIEFAASKVAATSGDARRVLQLVAKAIDKCVDKLKPSQLEAEFEFSSDAMPIVKIPCVMAVIRENNDKFTNTIKDLPPAAKIALCVGTTLARALDESTASSLTLGALRHYTTEALEHDCMDLSMDEFKSVVEMLVDSDLLQLAATDKNRLGTESMMTLSSAPFALELQLEDVESAMEKTLLQEKNATLGHLSMFW